MSHGNQSYLRFTLEESVWFQKGQEVDELLSIALDPNILVQESDQYVTIKGSLELSGEYNREEAHAEEEADYFSNPKVIQAVEVREEGVHLFTHHFPVEVTIPKNRIQELDEIDVFVETFDYAFPERSCLMLSADLMITGLYGEQQHELVEEEVERDVAEELEEAEEIEESSQFEPLFQEPAIPEAELSERPAPFEKLELAEEESSEFYKPFEVEARKVPQVEGQNKQGEEREEQPIEEEISHSSYVYERQDVTPTVDVYEQEEDVINRGEAAYEQVEASEEEVDEQRDTQEEIVAQQKNIVEDVIEETGEEGRVEVDQVMDEVNEAVAEQMDEIDDPKPLKESYPEIHFSSKRKEEKQSAPIAEESVQEVVEDDRDLFGTLQKKVMDQLTGSESSSSSSSSSSSPEQEEKQKSKKMKNKQSLTLSEFFARKDEEEHTRLKMCIVQNGDNLETISERYHVPVAQLQRVNEMELNQDIYEGQVLYIPVAQTQR